jgi:hypothetical protein
VRSRLSAAAGTRLGRGNAPPGPAPPEPGSAGILLTDTGPPEIPLAGIALAGIALRAGAPATGSVLVIILTPSGDAPKSAVSRAGPGGPAPRSG